MRKRPGPDQIAKFLREVQSDLDAGLNVGTIIDIVHQEGDRLIDTRRERARAILAEAPEAQLARLGPAVVDPDALTELVDDDPPWDDSEPAQAE